MFFRDLSNSFIRNCNVKCKRCGSVKNWNTTWSVFWTNLHCFVFSSSVLSKNWHFIILMSNSATCLLLLVAEQMYRNDQVSLPHWDTCSMCKCYAFNLNLTGLRPIKPIEYKVLLWRSFPANVLWGLVSSERNKEKLKEHENINEPVIQSFISTKL